MKELENKKRDFESCFVEVVHFGEDIILTSGSNLDQNDPDPNDN